MTSKITFEDRGQSLKEWTIDDDGFIQDCKPSEFGIWYGVHVRDHEKLTAGDRPWICRRKEPYLRHHCPIKSIERRTV